MLSMLESEAHVWCLSLASEPGRAESLCQILDESERQRATRFHFSRDQERFIIARGSLRLILAQYLNKTPDRIRFRYGPNGKPGLEANDIGPRWDFNLSHSSEVGLLVVTHGRRVGVDVEKIMPSSVDGLGIAERFFTPAEASLIRSFPADSRGDVFFRLWTRKEALLKGCGVGLSESLNRVEVSLNRSEIALPDSFSGPCTNWSIQEYCPCAGYIAAVAVEGTLPEFGFFSMEGAGIWRDADILCSAHE
jgi:4'-phosphopantetheinyl transferase